VQPEWFYKGDGQIVVDPGADIPSPDFALDGSEEPEIVGIYLIGEDREPYRLGFALGNEFSDHQTERMNYLYLAHSKLRHCAIGPELLPGALPNDIRGMSRIIRNGNVAWEKEFLSGEDNMSHSIANLEYHHFKYDAFLRPGDIHLHFFGTATLSFGDGFKTREGDIFEIECHEFGKPLRNRLSTKPTRQPQVRAL
ncbi:MAG: GguC family protein, partial [Pseudomonadales bacterium]